MPKACPYIQAILTHRLSLKTNGLDKHAKGMSLHSGYFDTAFVGCHFCADKIFEVMVDGGDCADVEFVFEDFEDVRGEEGGEG